MGAVVNKSVAVVYDPRNSGDGMRRPWLVCWKARLPSGALMGCQRRFAFEEQARKFNPRKEVV